MRTIRSATLRIQNCFARWFYPMPHYWHWVLFCWNELFSSQVWASTIVTKKNCSSVQLNRLHGVDRVSFPECLYQISAQSVPWNTFYGVFCKFWSVEICFHESFLLPLIKNIVKCVLMNRLSWKLVYIYIRGIILHQFHSKYFVELKKKIFSLLVLAHTSEKKRNPVLVL